MSNLQAIVDFILTYKWFAILIGIGIAALLLIRAYGGGVLKSFEKVGQEDADRFFKRVDINDTTRAYLEQASKAYSRFKFRGLPRARAKGIEPPQLDQAYISVRVVSENKKEEIDKKEQELGKIHKQVEPVQLSEAIKETPRLAVIGVAGSGKSTLLQWAGLAFARALLKKTLTDEQKEFVNASGGKPFVPFLIPLRAYSTYCEKNKCVRSSKTLLAFMAEYFSDHHASLELTVEFFKSHLKKGCLLMVDGLDEVAPEDRPAVRSAVEELLTEFDNPNLRCLIASRPSAIHVANQMQGFKRCEVQRLTSEQRDHLIELWHKAVLADDLHEARRKAQDLSSRIDKSDQSVQDLATTPLMVTIFAMVHYSRDELPKQRAKLYEDAVEVLLTEPYKGEEAKGLQTWGGMDWDIRRDRIARIAFELRERGKDSLLENDLVDLIWKRFGNEEAEARRITARFLREVTERGGLLEAVDESYGFYTHATFQEFLAGRYLAEEYPQNQLPMFLQEHIPNDLWDEALQLAAGYLAIKGERQANRFVLQIANSGTDDASNARALYVAGMALADVPEDRRLPNTLNFLVPQMKDLLTANPPHAKIRTRFNLGLALGSLGDPRFLARPLGDNQEVRAILPQLVNVPAGKFRIGTNEEDEKLQNTKYYHNQKPSHIVYISEFSIGKYPVTNLEYRAFYGANGYNSSEFWSEDGWNWRTGKWDTDLSQFFEDLQSYKDWLEGRPMELREKPFFWENPQWNAPNLPVVGITWFEAEAYCKWLSYITGKNYRLPTEAEWEKAARGTNNFMWPWGNVWDGDLCNNAGENTKEKLNRTSPVGMYPNGASSYGALDMIGNIWEWCHDWYDENEYKSRANKTVQDPRGPQNGKSRVVRGSSFFETDESIHCASRGQTGPEYFSSVNGFRVCVSPIIPSKP